MKKISLFIISIFAVGVTLAQSVDDFSFVPLTTDNNMSVVFPAGTLNDFTGGALMAFKSDGSPISAASTIAEDGSGSCPAADRHYRNSPNDPRYPRFLLP